MLPTGHLCVQEEVPCDAHAARQLTEYAKLRPGLPGMKPVKRCLQWPDLQLFAKETGPPHER
jgi:hypothetical protein